MLMVSDANTASAAEPTRRKVPPTCKESTRQTQTDTASTNSQSPRAEPTIQSVSVSKVPEGVGFRPVFSMRPKEAALEGLTTQQ